MGGWGRREILGTGLGVCSLALMPRPARAAKPVAFVDVSSTAPSWPLYVAAENGFFADEGLDVQTTFAGSNPAVVQQVISGSYELGTTTYETLVRAVDAGAGIKMIASLCLKYPYSVMARPEIKSAADMRGKTVMMPFANSPLTLFWNQWTKENGLGKDAVDTVYDGSTSNRFTALMSGTVAAAALTQPSDMLAAQKGFHILLDYGVYARDMGFTAIVATPGWLAKNPDTAKAYLRAAVRGVQFIYAPENRDRSIAILVKAAHVASDVAGQVYDYYTKTLKPFSPTLALPDDSVTGVLDELRLAGALTPGSHPVSKYVDRSFLPA